MLRFLLRSTFVATAVLMSGSLDMASPRQGLAQEGHSPHYHTRQYGQPDLFYNFYVPPAGGGVGSQMYPAPLPTPPLVGHTYYTYQPLMPHEMLYRHKRYYRTYYDNGQGMNRTRVLWW
jgi:hypothetical protein